MMRNQAASAGLSSQINIHNKLLQSLVHRVSIFGVTNISAQPIDRSRSVMAISLNF